MNPTIWRAVADLTNELYFLESTTSPNVIWVDLGQIDFARGSGTRMLDLVNHPDRIGDVTMQFKPAPPFKPMVPDPERDIRARR